MDAHTLYAFTHVPVGEAQGCVSADLMMPRGRRYNNSIRRRRGLFIGVETGYPLRRSIAPVQDLPSSFLSKVLLLRLLSGAMFCSVDLLGFVLARVTSACVVPFPRASDAFDLSSRVSLNGLCRT